MRLLVQWNLAAKTRPANADGSVRSGVRASTTSTRPCGRRRRTTRRSSSRSRARRAGRTAARTRTSCPRGSPTSPRSRARSRRATRAATRVSRSSASGRSGTSRTSSSSSAPQFDARGRSVAPANYAKLAAAAYTRPQGREPTRAGRDRRDVRARAATRRHGSGRRTRPGKFAELVAKANPRLKFDAWSHHPYPSVPNSPPSQVVKWPNVSLASLPRFDENLKTWFKRKSRPDLDHGVRAPDAAARTRSASRTRSRRPTSSSRSRWRPATRSSTCSSGSSTRTTRGSRGTRASTRARGAPKGTSPARFTRARGRSTRATAVDARPRRNAHAAPQRLHAPLLRDEHDRNADRDDVARVPRLARLISVGQQTRTAHASTARSPPASR